MPAPISFNTDEPIASTSTTACSGSVKASTSVKMSDGTQRPLSFRNSSFSRYATAPQGSFGPASVSMMLASPAFVAAQSQLSSSLVPMDLGFSLSPTTGFHPASYKGPGSFGASHLANMESSFCKNFVCCGLELDDLHGLLEHFEERHCQGGDIVGVEGFEGVTLDQMAEGVGVSKELGIGPGMGNAPEGPPGVGNGGFEGEEEWSSDGTQSGPPSPQTAHPNGSGSGLSLALQSRSGSSSSNTPSPPEGTVDPNGLTGGQTAARYREHGLSAFSTPATSMPGTPHPDDFDDMDDVEMDLGGSSAQRSAAGPPQLAAHSNDALAALMRNFSVGGPFHVGGLTGGAADVVSIPPSFLQGEPSAPEPSASTAAPTTITLGSSTISHPNPAIAANLAELVSQMTPGVLDQRPPQKKRTNLDPVTGLTPTGRQPRPWVPPSEKPFKCTVPGCDKAYKQQNGLKYHRTHGHCNQGLTPEEAAKPFVCHHDVCGKRYKNMNGLRYHYQHSGAHGMIGIQLLSLGAHPPPQYPPGHKKSANSTANTPAASRASSPSRCLPSSPQGARPVANGSVHNMTPKLPPQLLGLQGQHGRPGNGASNSRGLQSQMGAFSALHHPVSRLQ